VFIPEACCISNNYEALTDSVEEHSELRSLGVQCQAWFCHRHTLLIHMEKHGEVEACSILT